MQPKEYQFGEYKAIDTGYVIKLFKKTLDEFSTWYYRPISNHRYKEEPVEKDAGYPTPQFHLSLNEDYAMVIKVLLEENANLKFYNKMDDEIK